MLPTFKTRLLSLSLSLLITKLSLSIVALSCPLEIILLTNFRTIRKPLPLPHRLTLDNCGRILFNESKSHKNHNSTASPKYFRSPFYDIICLTHAKAANTLKIFIFNSSRRRRVEQKKKTRNDC